MSSYVLKRFKLFFLVFALGSGFNVTAAEFGGFKFDMPDFEFPEPPTKERMFSLGRKFLDNKKCVYGGSILLGAALGGALGHRFSVWLAKGENFVAKRVFGLVGALAGGLAGWFLGSYGFKKYHQI